MEIVVQFYYAVLVDLHSNRTTRTETSKTSSEYALRLET
jgi:hypothetical protein